MTFYLGTALNLPLSRLEFTSCLVMLISSLTRQNGISFGYPAYLTSIRVSVSYESKTYHR